MIYYLRVGTRNDPWHQYRKDNLRSIRYDEVPSHKGLIWVKLRVKRGL